MKAYDAIETPSCPQSTPKISFSTSSSALGEYATVLSERPGERTVNFNMNCEKEGKGARHTSDGCHDVAAIAPIVLNTFKGVRYCGRQS